MAIFVRMDGLDNKYLQKVNLEALQKETGMTLAELADLAKIGPKVIYKWRYMHKDSSRPDYNALVRLFEKGATVETLFGVDYKGHVQNSSATPPAENSSTNSFMESPEFKAKLAQSIKELKAKGVI